jgi:pyruvate/2-oxoglutarate dehydrogenase complex dihydrolipoamide dehydrogenase (E3) component
MATERSYDAIVIGAGQGGKPLSIVLAKAGLKTAVDYTSEDDLGHYSSDYRRQTKGKL